MFKLYRLRDFNALISDSFSFFKYHGKNYFKNYFIINGGILVVIALLTYLVTNVIFTSIGDFNSPGAQEMILNYFEDNVWYFISVGGLILLLLITLSLLNYSYPILYLKTLQDKQEPTVKDILTLLKSKAGKIILFPIASLISFIPLFTIIALISAFFVVTIIGIPVACIIIVAMGSWISLSFYDNITTNNGFFTSFSQGITILKNNFWANIGVSLIIGIVVFCIDLFFSAIPELLGSFTLLDETTDTSSISVILTIIGTTISVFVSYLLTNLTVISQGMIYYSYEESIHNRSLDSEIDLIGGERE
ncbi:hypothetical protein GN157_09875 [Flavobacterium rakeshii]|uniref:Glycerophosphoryl diester phosphodiesterase membrane domain-containing protein n=1 Tax=Flavobacterium rakeshii TaxID=1038845 RepID=A0A6N8HE63_9FLAO|nr:hypothetical protein [Flavobacterium rakeshii]MEE1898978.1 hypothetical protein [Flavobacterium rakeshii]MUV04016.1 hypothetical protein [Flavobacterium rakeshii]